MERYFSHSKCFDSDCFVADYTQQTNNEIGVVISDTPFVDIAYFHLIKRHKDQKLPYLAVNIEEYPAFMHGIENCECVFYSMSDKKKPWILFLETKYCESRNIDNHAVKACSQMKSTLEKLEDEGLVDRHASRVYFVYSVPEHTEMAPFGAFLLSQDFGLRLKEEGISLLGCNTMVIATPSYLIAPKVKV